MSCWVYVLRSEKNGRQYVGITSNPDRRVREHNAGHSKSTAAGRPYRLGLKEWHEDHAAAREREKFLKSGQGREFVAGHE